MYPTLSMKTISTTTIHLVRNKIEIKRLRIALGLGIFILPTILAGIIFYFVLGLNVEEWIFMVSITGLILLNLALFTLGRLTKEKRTLLFGYGNIRVIDHNKNVQVIPLEQLKISPIHWNNNQKSKPEAYQIRARGMPCMTISKRGIMQKKATQSENKCTNFWTTTEEEWQQLQNLLSTFLESNN